eukprot:180214-Pleurochrysis_carterae.AAC.1
MDAAKEASSEAARSNGAWKKSVIYGIFPKSRLAAKEVLTDRGFGVRESADASARLSCERKGQLSLVLRAEREVGLGGLVEVVPVELSHDERTLGVALDAALSSVHDLALDVTHLGRRRRRDRPQRRGSRKRVGIFITLFRVGQGDLQERITCLLNKDNLVKSTVG